MFVLFLCQLCFISVSGWILFLFCTIVAAEEEGASKKREDVSSATGAEEAKVEEQGNMVDTACDEEGKAGLVMAAPGVSAGISITGGGGRVQSPEVWFVCMGE